MRNKFSFELGGSEWSLISVLVAFDHERSRIWDTWWIDWCCGLDWNGICSAHSINDFTAASGRFFANSVGLLIHNNYLTINLDPSRISAKKSRLSFVDLSKLNYPITEACPRYFQFFGSMEPWRSVALMQIGEKFLREAHADYPLIPLIQYLLLEIIVNLCPVPGTIIPCRVKIFTYCMACVSGIELNRTPGRFCRTMSRGCSKCNPSRIRRNFPFESDLHFLQTVFYSSHPECPRHPVALALTKVFILGEWRWGWRPALLNFVKQYFQHEESATDATEELERESQLSDKSSFIWHELLMSTRTTKRTVDVSFTLVESVLRWNWRTSIIFSI